MTRSIQAETLLNFTPESTKLKNSRASNITRFKIILINLSQQLVILFKLKILTINSTKLSK